VGFRSAGTNDNSWYVKIIPEADFTFEKLFDVFARCCKYMATVSGFAGR